MTIYDIDRQIYDLFSQVNEDGELPEDIFEQLEALNISRNEKIENTALYYKNVTATAKAVKEEEQVLAKKRKALEKEAAKLEYILASTLRGETFQTAINKVSFIRSVGTVVEDESLITEEYKNPQPSKISLSKIKVALQEGKEVPGARLEERSNIQIK